MSFDWNHARTFLAAADAGSLSAAARLLNQTQPTVSRQIAALEAALGVTLFERTGRAVYLTQAGIELVEHVRAMQAGANLVSLSASGKSQSIEGQVRITASDMVAAHLLPPVLKSLRRAAPQLEIDVIADNGVKDLVQREADIAIRHARPEQPGLVTRRLRDEMLRFYASESYLKAHGDPRPDALAHHQILSFVDADRMLGYLCPLGLDLTRANFRITASTQLAAWELARSGLGMMIMHESVAKACPDMRPVLTEIEPFTIPVWLVAHRELKTSRRIRMTFDLLADALS